MVSLKFSRILFGNFRGQTSRAKPVEGKVHFLSDYSPASPKLARLLLCGACKIREGQELRRSKWEFVVLVLFQGLMVAKILNFEP